MTSNSKKLGDKLSKIKDEPLVGLKDDRSNTHKVEYLVKEKKTERIQTLLTPTQKQLFVEKLKEKYPFIKESDYIRMVVFKDLSIDE